MSEVNLEPSYELQQILDEIRARKGQSKGRGKELSYIDKDGNLRTKSEIFKRY